MMSSVPQFIDVEDKIAGPLTWRQLLWMIGMGATLLVLFNVFEQMYFVIFSVPVVLVFVALAFYRPNNQPLILYVTYAIYFLFRPKIAVWERPVKAESKPKPKAPEPASPIRLQAKKVTLQELHALARMVDSR